jgi:hypothetical protein
MKRSPLKPSSKPLRRRKPLSKVSAKRKREGKRYERIRFSFLAQHPLCQACLYEKAMGRQRHVFQSTEIQHKALRGKYYLRTDTWAAVCREHGERCTTDNPWAYESGMRLTREQIRNLP